jgi:hypothetical protein
MNDVEGEKISDTDYLTTLLVNYFSNEGSALYHVPVLGDASSMEFIKYYKDTSLEYKDNILDKMFDIFLYEIGRMRLIRERKRMGIAPGDTRYIDNIDSIGDSFVIFPSFNSQKGFFELADAMILQGKTNELKNLFVESQRAVMDNGAAAFREYMGDLGLLQKTESGKYTRLNSIGITEMGLNNATDNYFYNSYFATMNIILMTSSDMAFFKSVEDFQKRNKELHAPGTAPNTSATYNGVRVGKDIERSIVIEDEVSPISEATRANIESILDRSNLTAAEKKNIMKSYSENTVTDGQGFRTLKGFKTVISMFTG